MKLKLGILLALLLLTGCTDEHILERTGFIRTIAYDLAGENNGNLLRVTISIPMSNHQDAIVYSTIAKSDKNAKMIFDRQNNRKLVNGQLRQVVFGERLATQGVWKHLDALIRDPSIGTRLHVIIAEADPQHLLIRNDYPQGPTAGEYIDTLIRTESKSGEVPGTNLYTFARDFYDDGIDPVATIIKEEKESIMINGIALFRNDKYVGKIKPEDRMFFALLHHNVRAGDLYMDLTKQHNVEEQATLQFLSSHRKVKVLSSDHLLEGKKLKVAIHINVHGSLLEYIGDLDMKKSADQKKLEHQMQREIQNKCKSLIATMQKEQTDPLGIGQRVRNSIPHNVWNKLPWKDIYSKADITVQVDVNIKDYGKMLH